ncbi:MAG TPA: rod shape-determining protein MreD [Gammaproteobacteria bacterium]|nr:rod shape-determining protein MreD [Gammaproteobacteria bacterium]
MAARRTGWQFPALTLVLALALTVVPLPAPIAPYRPEWVPLILIFWSLLAPHRFGLLTAFWMGLMLDSLSGALLGQHALALVVVVYLTIRFHLRIRVFPVWQLSVTIVLLLALYEFVLFWVDGVAGRTVPLIERWAPLVASAVVWPFILGYLDHYRHDAQVRV